ncbi:hypothetical protein MTR67_039874, partial [Solanum verrucosum]
VGLAKPLGELPFGHFHLHSTLAFNIVKVCNFGRSSTALRKYLAIRRLLLSLTDLISSLRTWYTRTLGGQIAIQRFSK